MLRLVFYTADRFLKVRYPLPHDSFEKSCKWQDKLEFIITDKSQYVMIWTSMLPDLEAEYAVALSELVGSRYPLSPNYSKLKDMCPEVVFQNGTDEWVFFGGSFDPWHQGHQACLSLLPDDKTCLVIPDRNPFKDLRKLNPVATILELSTKARFKKNQFIVPTFLFTEEKNPTVEWIERVKEELPLHRLSLLMGFDSFANISKWTRASDLLPLLHTVYVVSRLEDDEDRREALDFAHSMGPDLDVVFLGKHEFESLSSTEIRMNQK